MRTTRVTLRDIAKEAECSVSVVSAVLNKPKTNTKVSKNTANRIRDIAARLNYHPNFASRSLKNNKTKTLGIYVENGPWKSLANSYEITVFRGIERAARERGYDLLLINIGNDFNPKMCTEKFAENRIDGILVIRAEAESKTINELMKITNKVVAIDYSYEKPGLDSMIFHNYEAVRLAIDYLSEMGHERIGFIGSCLDKTDDDASIRQAAFKDIIDSENRNKVGNADFIFGSHNSSVILKPEGEFCQKEGELGAKYFMNMGTHMPTAILCYNDLVGIEAMKYLILHGIKVPEQVSIIGVDNSERCEYCIPALTSIEHPLEEMGYQGTTLLIDKNEGVVTQSGAHRYFTPKIVIRDSVINMKGDPNE